MSRQDKAVTERHTKLLRELVKTGDNKVCADCKRNDPRWASWNLGVFLCIRCSGIHRGMGTHISKVKSVDLDTWTPEQMESIQKWGNHRANLYWEAHLKAGHVPPEHKMESFVRSKYESRRWALDGPPPQDPSVLEDQSASSAAPPVPVPQTSRPTHTQSNSISNRRPASPAQVTNRQPQPRQLLSAAVTADRNQQNRSQAAIKPVIPLEPPIPEQKIPENDLFSLDFRTPPPPTSNNTLASQPKKDVKQDILSLFSTPAPVTSNPAFGQFNTEQSVWGQPQQPQVTSMVGSNGPGAWGVSSGWNASAAPAQGNLWGAPVPAPQQQQHQPGVFGSQDIWGSSTGSSAGTTNDLFGTSFSNPTQKKDDAFGDIWGGFK